MEKRRFKVNVLDFLILALVAIVIAGAALRANVKQKDTKLETQTAVISFKVSNVQSVSVKYFHDGDPVWSDSLGCTIGTLIVDSITSSPAVTYAEHGGAIVKTTSALNRVDICGSVECEGQMSESGFLLGGTQYIAPGVSTYACLPEINAYILITDIRIK